MCWAFLLSFLRTCWRMYDKSSVRSFVCLSGPAVADTSVSKFQDRAGSAHAQQRAPGGAPTLSPVSFRWVRVHVFSWTRSVHRYSLWSLTGHIEETPNVFVVEQAIFVHMTNVVSPTRMFPALLHSPSFADLVSLFVDFLKKMVMCSCGFSKPPLLSEVVYIRFQSMLNFRPNSEIFCQPWPNGRFCFPSVRICHLVLRERRDRFVAYVHKILVAKRSMSNR